MFNTRAKYENDYAEAMAEDPQGTMRFLHEEREKALKTYPKGIEIKKCSICGEPLPYDSQAYLEGYHFDNCI